MVFRSLSLEHLLMCNLQQEEFGMEPRLIDSLVWPTFLSSADKDTRAFAKKNKHVRYDQSATAWLQIFI